MEGNEQRRRQYEHQIYPRGSVTEYGGHGVDVPDVQNLPRAPVGDGSDRFRQTQPLTTRPSTSGPLSAGVGNPHELGSYEYAPGQQCSTPQIHGPQFQYQPEYLQDPQRQRQTPQYSSQLMYNVPQQAQSQSPYDDSSQYQSRQSAALVLGSQFAVPQYYSPSHGTNVSGPAAISQRYPTTAYPPSVQYTSAASLGRTSLASSYSTLGPPDSNSNNERAASEQPEEESDIFTAAYDRCLKNIEVVNDHTSKGRLIKAGESLLTISQWLSENVDALRLTQDDEAKHEESLKIWDNFNICWLALLQRQEDDTLQVVASGRRPAHFQNLLPKEFLEKLGNGLISLCDGLEKNGLVDYQRGVSEQEIVEILTRCIDLLSSDDENDETEIDPMLGQSGSGTGKQ